MAIRTLYLVRHGQYDATVKAADGGGLSDIGKQQAEYAAQALQGIPMNVIYASTMVRAIETANIIAQKTHSEYKVTDLLREAIPSIPPRIAIQIMEMMARDTKLTHESIHEDGKRADEAFAEFFIAPPIGESQNMVLCCHGNIIRYLTSKALGVSTDTWAKLNINHCSISIFTINEQGLIRLHSYNETGHLPSELKTD
jgi:serine/threonine-protein phosphatase PGAM5